jgi:hypothetical protein
MINNLWCLCVLVHSLYYVMLVGDGGGGGGRMIRYKAGGVYEGEWADGDKNGNLIFSYCLFILSFFSYSLLKKMKACASQHLLQLYCLSFAYTSYYLFVFWCVCILVVLLNAGVGVYTYPSGDVYDGLFLHGNLINQFLYNVKRIVEQHTRILTTFLL